MSDAAFGAEVVLKINSLDLRFGKCGSIIQCQSRLHMGPDCKMPRGRLLGRNHIPNSDCVLHQVYRVCTPVDHIYWGVEQCRGVD